MKITNHFFASCVAVGGALLAIAGQARADFLLIDLYEIGSDVVADVTGNFNYSSLVPQETGTSTMFPYSAANSGDISGGPTTAGVSWVNWRLINTNGYSQPFWGDGLPAGTSPSIATSAVGPLFRIIGNPTATPGEDARIRLPATYVSGSPLDGTVTWANKTLAQLGLQSSGTWTFDSVADGLPEVTLRINAVPEPATIGLASIGAGLCGLIGWRRMRRAKNA
jgi:hypothetical protein